MLLIIAYCYLILAIALTCVNESYCHYTDKMDENTPLEATDFQYNRRYLVVMCLNVFLCLLKDTQQSPSTAI